MENDLEAGPTAHDPDAVVASRNGGHVFVYAVMAIITVSIGVAIVDSIYLDQRILLPTFSVNLEGFDGLDGLPPKTPASTVSPTFNLTLHAVSRRSSRSRELCVERGSVAVSYAGAVLAWGRVSGFCVAPHAQKHVRMVALGTEVGLSDELRQGMASERRSGRAPELDVAMTLRVPAGAASERRLLSCRVDMESAPSQPSPCKVFVFVIASH